MQADIGRSIIEMADLAVKLCCNVYVYDYSGYGQSSGTPSEGNLYADIHASWDYLQTRSAVTNPTFHVIHTILVRHCQ
jgi:hypothetical protein